MMVPDCLWVDYSLIVEIFTISVEKNLKFVRKTTINRIARGIIFWRKWHRRCGQDM